MRKRCQLINVDVDHFEALGCDIRICMVYTIKPYHDICCFWLNFNISNVGCSALYIPYTFPIFYSKLYSVL